MKIPFASYSNIGGQIRVSIMAEDLDKMTDEQRAELKRLNARICICNLDDSIRVRPEKTLLPSYEEVDAILQRAKSDDSTQSGRINDDFQPILDLM